MTALPIAFKSDKARFPEFSSTYVLNGYAEKLAEDAKTPLALYACDGLTQFTQNGSSPCRGMIYLPDLDCIYAAHHSSCYKITRDGVSARIGTIPGVGPVQFSRNQRADVQVMAQTDVNVLLIESDSITYVLDTDILDTPVTSDYVSGYHVLGFADRRFQLSGLNSANQYNALDFATFEQKAGGLLRVIGDRGELFGFCSNWTEVWRNVDDPDFPFQLVSTIERGLIGPQAVDRCNNTLMFVGDDGVAYRIVNYSLERISTHYVERLIQNDVDRSSISAVSWTKDGHVFFSLTGTDWTVCYDAVTGVWHNRESHLQSKWRVNYAVAAWGKVIVGDRLSGKLFYMDSESFSEDGDVMVWGVDSPPMHAFPHGGIIDALHLDLATGHGTESGQGVDPKVMLSVSKDGGYTYGQDRELSLGAGGHHGARMPPARRLGRFGPKGAVFRLRISDPVVRGLVAADAQVRPLRR